MRRLLLAVLALGFCFGATAAAQYIPPPPEPTCVRVDGIPCPGDSTSGSSDSTTRPDPIAVWKARFAAIAEANRKRKAAAEARKQRADALKASQRQALIDAKESYARSVRQLEEAA